MRTRQQKSLPVHVCAGRRGRRRRERERHSVPKVATGLRKKSKGRKGMAKWGGEQPRSPPIATAHGGGCTSQAHTRRRLREDCSRRGEQPPVLRFLQSELGGRRHPFIPLHALLQSKDSGGGGSPTWTRAKFDPLARQGLNSTAPTPSANKPGQQHFSHKRNIVALPILLREKKHNSCLLLPVISDALSFSLPPRPLPRTANSTFHHTLTSLLQQP